MLTPPAASWRKKAAERLVQSAQFPWLTGGLDESKKVLGILYRSMKPILDGFDPKITTEYDDCLRGIPYDQYLQRASELKAQYGNFDRFSSLIS